MSSLRSEVYTILDCLDAGKAIPDELRMWLPLAEVEGLVRYTTTPEDVLPISYPLFGPPRDIYLELTEAGKAALAQWRESRVEGGAS